MGDTSQEYHAHPAVSRSDLWLFSRSRRVYRASKDRLMDVPKAMLPPAKFDAFEVGSAAHIALLEPERFERDVVVWNKRRTTSRGGGSSTDWERFRDAHAGKVIVTLKQWFLVQTVTAVVNHRMQPLMASRAAAREQPLYWTEEVEVDGEIVEDRMQGAAGLRDRPAGAFEHGRHQDDQRSGSQQVSQRHPRLRVLVAGCALHGGDHAHAGSRTKGMRILFPAGLKTAVRTNRNGGDVRHGIAGSWGTGPKVETGD